MTGKARAVTPLLAAVQRSAAWPVVVQDLDRWWETRLRFLELVIARNDPVAQLRHCVHAYREFRNVLYYRLAAAGPTTANLAKVARRVWRPVDTLDLACPDIGTGLVVRHGYCTILSAERIGRNCFVHHGVTVGWDEEGERAPRLGDGVYVGTGAKVLGAITIGNDVRIGANAVVLRDVPDGCTAVGVPARVLRAPMPTSTSANTR